MQKVTAFLEQHVQWIAIGLGALFCLYMTYSYVITPPAEATVDGRTLGPSEIDPHTAETAAAKLQSAMQSSGRIRMEVPQYVQAFQDAMTWKNAEPVQLANMTDRSLTLDVEVPKPPPVPGQPTFVQNQQPGITPGTAPENVKITQLPVPPKPVYGDVKYGRSMIVPPPPPGMPAPQLQPGQIPPGAVDKDWVTQMWKVSMGDIEAAWRNAGFANPNLPPDLRKTMFLQVEMVREEMVNGQWGNEKVIPHLGVTRNNQPMLPYPGDKADPALKQQQFQYALWAATNTADIIQPLFHQTVQGRGDEWSKPGALVAMEVFNPETFEGDLNTLTPEQKKLVLEARRLRYRQMMDQKKQSAPGPRAPRTPGGGRGLPPEIEGGEMYSPRRSANYAPMRAEQFPHYAPAPGMRPPPIPPYPPRGGYRGEMPPELMEMEGGYGGYGGVPQAPGMPQPGTDFPAGEFDPLEVPPPPWKFDPLTQQPRQVEIWAHDDNVEAGKTYRYKMRYKLKNPIFATNAGEPPQLGEQFALISEFSDWSPSMTVPALVNFFVAGGMAGNRKTVAFEIFRWQDGQQKSERFDVGPGDPVGWEKNGMDFSTDWTVVDFVQDVRANDPQILLLNNKDGSVIARSYNTDRNDKLYNALQKQVRDAKAAEQAALQAAGGVVPGVAGTAAAR